MKTSHVEEACKREHRKCDKLMKEENYLLSRVSSIILANKAKVNSPKKAAPNKDILKYLVGKKKYAIASTKKVIVRSKAKAFLSKVFFLK